MTIKSFLNNLKYIKGEWTCNIGVIRLNHPDGCFCPLTAMLYNEEGEMVGNMEFFYAGNKLGLNKENTRNIANAADNISNKILKNKILKTIGLK